jgi:adenylate kinase
VICAGDLLRDAVKKGNKELEAIMKEGKLVPLETTVGLLRDAMVTSGGKIFLVDGFPRAADQAAAFEASVQAPEAVLFFDCSEAVMRERLLSRGKTSGRADDNEDTIVKRFHTFVEQSKPVVEAYKARKLCVEVSAMRTPVEVFADVKAALDARLRGAGGKELPKGSKIVFVLGGPGSGKGTQCEKILAHYKDFVHLSAGAGPDRRSTVVAVDTHRVSI